MVKNLIPVVRYSSKDHLPSTIPEREREREREKRVHTTHELKHPAWHGGRPVALMQCATQTYLKRVVVLCAWLVLVGALHSKLEETCVVHNALNSRAFQKCRARADLDTY